MSEVRQRGKLSEADVDAAMREIRLALLEADVNFKVVKDFTAQVKQRCLDSGTLDSLNPGQLVVKVVNEELASLMGGASRDLAFASSGPTVILMAGLRGRARPRGARSSPSTWLPTDAPSPSPPATPSARRR